MIPEQHSDRLQANDLCFARLIGLLLGDLGQRPMHGAPSTAGGCNAEASRRYLLESRALDPQRQRLLLVLPSLQLLDLQTLDYQVVGDGILVTAPVAGFENIAPQLSDGAVIGLQFIHSAQGAIFSSSGKQMENGFFIVKTFVDRDTLAATVRFIPTN